MSSFDEAIGDITICDLWDVKENKEEANLTKVLLKPNNTMIRNGTENWTLGPLLLILYSHVYQKLI